jgi:hypothetical protein
VFVREALKEEHEAPREQRERHECPDVAAQAAFEIKALRNQDVKPLSQAAKHKEQE